MSLITRIPRYILIDIMKRFVDCKDVIKLWLSCNERDKTCLKVIFPYLTYYYTGDLSLQHFSENINRMKYWAITNNFAMVRLTIETVKYIMSVDHYEILKDYIHDLSLINEYDYLKSNTLGMYGLKYKALGIYGSFVWDILKFIDSILTGRKASCCIYQTDRSHEKQTFYNIAGDSQFRKSKVIIMFNANCIKYDDIRRYIEESEPFCTNKFVLCLFESYTEQNILEDFKRNFPLIRTSL